MALDRPPAVTTKLGKYELLREQAGSGIGSIWIARAADDATEAAQLYTLLRLHRHILKKSETADTFLAEARKAQHFRHPNALALLDLGTIDGEVFVASEFTAGEALSALLAASGPESLTAPVVLRIGLDVLEAVAAAHAESPPLVHGELGPQHVYIAPDGVARVGGFAVARALAKLNSPTTKNHERLAYAAPERVKAMAAPLSSTVAPDPRADLFSVGVLLWELFSNKRLFSSKIEAAVIQKVLTAPIPALSSLPGIDVPSDVNEALQKALEREPLRRFQSAGEMIMALEGAGPDWIAPHEKVSELFGKLTARLAEPKAEPAVDRSKASPPAKPVRTTAKLGSPSPALQPQRPAPGRKQTLLGLMAVVPSPPPNPEASPNGPPPQPAKEEARGSIPDGGTPLPHKPVAKAPVVEDDDWNVGASTDASTAAEKPAEAAGAAASPAPPAAPAAPLEPPKRAKAAPWAKESQTQLYGTPAQLAGLPKSAAPNEVAARAQAQLTPEPGAVRQGAAGAAGPKPPVKPSASAAVASSGDAAASAVATFTARSFGRGKSPSTEPKVVIGSTVPHPPPAPSSPGSDPSKVTSIHTGSTPSDAPADSKRGRTATALDKLGPGSTLGRYEILMPVARGGMASVWGARLQGTRGFQKIVAIKTMLPDVSDDPDFESMFLDEAKVAARIRHPNVAEILDLGEQDDVLYLVMEWVEGENLSTLLKAARSHGRIPLPIALRIASQACAGLHAAHELRDDAGHLVDLIHRDVSPANVLVSTAGFVKLVDFGVAKSKNRLHVTRAGGMVKGKTPYLSPEQLGQLPIDRRSDIFSFGALLYVLLTGLHPFRGETESKTVENIALKDPVAIRSIVPATPVELEKVVLKALEKDPEKRYSTAVELQRAIDQIAVSIGAPISDHDVADFVRTAIGELTNKRAQDLRNAIALLDAEVAKTESVRAWDVMPPRPPTVERYPGLASADATAGAPALPIPPLTPRPPPPPTARAASTSLTEDEISFEEVPNPGPGATPVPTVASTAMPPVQEMRAPGSPEIPLAGSPSPALPPMVEETTPPTTALDEVQMEGGYAPPLRRRPKLQLIVGGAVGACALIGVLALVAGNKGATKSSRTTVQTSAAEARSVVLPAVTAAATAAKPVVSAVAEAAPPPASTPLVIPAPTASAAAASAVVATAESAAIAPPPPPPPPPKPKALVAPVRPVSKPIAKPVAKPPPPPPSPSPKSTAKTPPRKYNPTGI